MATISLQQKAYDLIKSRIINCEYLPGLFLSTLELQDNLGYSRTPIREAIGRLEQENLVRVISKKGIMVSDVSLGTVRVIYETRLLIEPFIIVNYGDKIDQAELLRMREIFKNNPFESGLTKQQFFDYDGELHGVFCRACPNIYLVRTLNQIYAQDKRVRVLLGTLGYRLEESCHEHVNIIDALMKQDLARAEKLIIEHLTASRDNAFRLPNMEG